MAQIAPSLGDLEANRDLHLEQIAAARREHCDLIVFPELSLTGYWLRDLVAEVALVPETAPLLAPLKQASRDIDIVLGLVEAGADGRSYNSAIWLSGGRVLWRHRKIYLPTYTLFDEGRDFAAGDRVAAFDSSFGRTGLLVCEDLWHPALAYLLALEGGDLLVTISSSPARGIGDTHLESEAAWRLFARTTARSHTQFVAYVGRVGVEDGHTFAGGSRVYAPDGRLLAELPALKEASATVELDRRDLRRARIISPLRRDERPDLVHRELGRILKARTGTDRPE